MAMWAKVFTESCCQWHTQAGSRRRNVNGSFLLQGKCGLGLKAQLCSGCYVLSHSWQISFKSPLVAHLEWIYFLLTQPISSVHFSETVGLMSLDFWWFLGRRHPHLSRDTCTQLVGPGHVTITRTAHNVKPAKKSLGSLDKIKLLIYDKRVMRMQTLPPLLYCLKSHHSRRTHRGMNTKEHWDRAVSLRINLIDFIIPLITMPPPQRKN